MYVYFEYVQQHMHIYAKIAMMLTLPLLAPKPPVTTVKVGIVTVLVFE